MGISNYLRDLRSKIGHDPILMPGVTAVVKDDAGRILLVRTRDDGKWYLVGGAMDPGEQPADAAVREVLEETGLTVVPERLLGVYAEEPVRYANGDVVWYVASAFLCRIVSGTPRISDDELLEVRFFDPAQMPPIPPSHRMRVQQALEGKEAAQFVFNGNAVGMAHE